jgi:hypothetical protein
VALEVPALVKAADPARTGKRGGGATPAPDSIEPVAPPAATERKAAVVTIRRKSRFNDVDASRRIPLHAVCGAACRYAVKLAQARTRHARQRQLGAACGKPFQPKLLILSPTPRRSLRGRRSLLSRARRANRLRLLVPTRRIAPNPAGSSRGEFSAALLRRQAMTPPKAVITPDDRFVSLRLAAAHYGISYTTARRGARQGQYGWRYADPIPVPMIVLASKPTRKFGPRGPKPT